MEKPYSCFYRIWPEGGESGAIHEACSVWSGYHLNWDVGWKKIHSRSGDKPTTLYMYMNIMWCLVQVYPTLYVL